MMRDIVFANPELLYLLLINVPLIAWYIFKQKTFHASIQVSTLNGLDNFRTSPKVILRHLLFVFRVLSISTIIIILARPQSVKEWKEEKTEGIDIAIAIDVSSSMLSKDFEPNRLEASKDVAMEFVSGRTNDRIGLVVFSGESFTQCPVTSDHAVLLNVFRDIKCGIIQDGTAIGLGLATAVNRLKESSAKSKVAILLTDGVNNHGDIPPLTAAEIARTYGIKVYTIGVGTNGMALSPYGTNPWTGELVFRNMPVEIDEDVLKEIASLTGGQYFRATDKAKMTAIYEQIDKMEKTEVDVREYSQKDERYFWLAVLASLLLFLEILLRNTIFRNIP